MTALCSRELLYGAILMIGSMTFGFTLTYPSPTLVELRSTRDISTIAATLYNAIPAATAIGGPSIAELILRKSSYRWAVFLVGIAGVVLWVALLFLTDKDIWLGVFGRAMIGFVLGSMSSICPLYINEIAPKEWKGIYGSVNQLGITSGVTFCFLISTWLSWKFLCCVCAVMFLMLIALVWIVPDRKATVAEGQRESLWQKRYLLKLTIGVATMFFQQFCGVNAIVTNLDSLFKNAGITIPTGIASAIASSAQVIAACIGSIMIQKLGRRRVWMISLSGAAAAHVFHALCLRFKDWPSVLPIVAVFVFLLFFGCGAGPIPWFIIPQMFPISVRSVAMSVGTSLAWVFVFAIIILFPYLSAWLGQFGCFIGFACVSMVGVIYGFFMIKDNDTAEGAYTNVDSTEETTDSTVKEDQL